jgi:hypothetical protein
LGGDTRTKADFQNSALRLDIQQGEGPLGIVYIVARHPVPNPTTKGSAWVTELSGDELD